MRCLGTMKIIEVLRLGEQGFSQREIAASVKCSKSSVGEVQRRCRKAGLTWEQAKGLGDEAIHTLLYPELNGGRPVKKEPDWKSIQEQLDKRPRLTLQYIFEEQPGANPGGLSRSQFYEHYAKWKNTQGRSVVMVQEREPGKELFVDWAGDTLECVKDSETGKLLKAHFFVSTLGDSGYPTVIAYPDEKAESWLDAHVQCFERLDGVPRVVVPDNLKTGVKKANYYDPEINTPYHDLALHYNVAIIPARVRSPRDKAQVESSVGWIETWLLEWLRGQIFSSFLELNGAIKKRMAELVKKPFQKRAGSRESVFLELDKPALQPLPRNRFERPIYVKRTVPSDYHLDYGEFRYSVPYRYYKQQVKMKITCSVVEVYTLQRELIAIHIRRHTGPRNVTERSHMPLNHQFQQDASRFDGKRYRSWAEAIGVNTAYVIDHLLTQTEFEETAYRSCMGILQFSKKEGKGRLEAACRRARELKSITYGTIKNILKNHQEDVPPQNELFSKPTPAHENLRGPHAFR